MQKAKVLLKIIIIIINVISGTKKIIYKKTRHTLNTFQHYVLNLPIIKKKNYL